MTKLEERLQTTTMLIIAVIIIVGLIALIDQRAKAESLQRTVDSYESIPTPQYEPDASYLLDVNYDGQVDTEDLKDYFSMWSACVLGE
jgi:hypothetical protein